MTDNGLSSWLQEVALQVTEHIDEQHWVDMCTLFGHDLNKRDSENDRIRLKGMKINLRLYQAYAVYMLTLMENWQNNGCNASDMGLGKVCHTYRYKTKALERSALLTTNSAFNARISKTA